MALTTEAIIAIVALFIALPPAVIILLSWKKLAQRRAVPDTEMQLAPRHSWQLPLLPLTPPALLPLPAPALLPPSPSPSPSPSSSTFPSEAGMPLCQYRESRLLEENESCYVAIYQGYASRYPKPSSSLQRGADRQGVGAA